MTVAAVCERGREFSASDLNLNVMTLNSGDNDPSPAKLERMQLVHDSY